LRAVSKALGCTVDYDPKAGIFIWGGPQTPQVPGLPPDETSAPLALPSRPAAGRAAAADAGTAVT